MRSSHLTALVAITLLAACDVAPSPTSRIVVRSASVSDDSMQLDVSVDGQDREVQIVEIDETRVVAVFARTTDEPMVTLVSEAEPECVTEDAVACELTDAAFDGTLEQLAAQVADDVQFRKGMTCSFEITASIMLCWNCEEPHYATSYCIGL